MTDFWLHKSNPVRKCETFANLDWLNPIDTSVSPSKTYASWQTYHIKGTKFSNTHRFFVLDRTANGATLYRYQKANHELIERVELTIQTREVSPGQTEMHFLMSADETVYVFRYSDGPRKVLLQHYALHGASWDHRPALPEMIAYNLSVLPLYAGPTQEDEGGGYVP